PKLDIDDRPYSTFQQSFETAIEIPWDMNARVSEVVHRRPVLVLARQKANFDPIDKPVAAQLFDLRLGFVGFVVPEVIRSQSFLDGFDSDADFILVIGSAVLAKQIFEYVGRDVFTTLDLVKQVLPNNPAGEYLGQFSVECVRFHRFSFTQVPSSSASVDQGLLQWQDRWPEFRLLAQKSPRQCGWVPEFLHLFEALRHPSTGHERRNQPPPLPALLVAHFHQMHGCEQSLNRARAN